MARHNEIGQWGESLAVDYLTEHGYAIVERNWREHRMEIDIIAMKDDVLVVCEVKTRSSKDEDPLDAVDSRKVLSMVRAAEAYVRINDIPHQVRFDLFAVVGTPDDYVFEHVPDAFYPPLRTYY